MLENGARRSFTPVIDWSLVTIVMSALISDPVASVPMNESTPRPTTTNALMNPMASAVPSASATAGGGPRGSGDGGDDPDAGLRDEVRDDDAAQGHREGDREVEDARGER